MHTSLRSGRPGGNPRGRRPRTRDLVQLDGVLYRIAAQAVAPEPGFWLGRADTQLLCERFVPRDQWALVWDPRAQRWEAAA